jgi:O-acetyl-ADP-ribose deacetylase (regulator of RNase III)
MNSITYKQGNVLDVVGRNTILAHGVNCRGAFGAGIARQIAERWPEVRKAYMDKYWSEGWHLGETQLVRLPRPEYTQKLVWNFNGYGIIANCATQLGYGYKLTQNVYVNYEAVERCLEQVFGWANFRKQLVVMPKIGAGLAGGDWKVIEEILKEIHKKFPVKVEVYEYVPKRVVNRGSSI